MPGDQHTYGFNRRDAESLVATIRTGETETPERRRRGGGGGRNQIYLTPAGGIAAMSGTSTPWTPGSATCTLCEQYDDSGTWKIRTTSPAQTDTIYNMVSQAIAGSVLIQVKPIGGKLYVDTANCGS